VLGDATHASQVGNLGLARLATQDSAHYLRDVDVSRASHAVARAASITASSRSSCITNRNQTTSASTLMGDLTNKKAADALLHQAAKSRSIFWIGDGLWRPVAWAG
jgi:hypothetical protein